MPDAALGRRLLDLLRPRQEEMVRLVEDLVRLESPSEDAAAQAGVLERLGAELAERGFRTRRIRGRRSGGSLLALPRERARRGPRQLLLGHADTVWPLGTVSERPPEVRAGRLHGPGSYDMKAGLVQGLFALEAAATALEGRLPVTPLVLVNTDEEIGSRESTQSIRRLARLCERVFVLEPSLGPEGALKTSRKGIGRFTVKVQGKAAHAGLDPDKGASAILELSLVIQKLFALNDPEHGVTVNVGMIDGGLQPNVVAPESSAVVDVRVRTHEDAARIEAAIHGLEPSTPGTALAVEGRIGRPPMEPTPGNRRLWTMAKESAELLGLSIDEAAVGGGSDGNTTSQTTPTLDGLGPVGEGAHALHESLVVEALAERAALLAMLLIHPPLAGAS
jgi:glutamate carboxypeptidase